jgi:hypothetical protein
MFSEKHLCGSGVLSGQKTNENKRLQQTTNPEFSENAIFFANHANSFKLKMFLLQNDGGWS